MADITIIGLGLIGQALAERFLRAGHRVAGFDISQHCRNELEKAGGQAAADATSAIAQSDVCVLSLPTSDVVASVVQEMSGGLSEKLLIDTTTGAPESSEATGRQVKEQGGEYLDATIVGSSALVRAGEVVVLVGGDERAYEKSLPWLSCFSRKCFHLGPWGSGARMKLVVNLVLGLNRAVLAEGLAFAAATGIEPSQALEVLQSGVAYSRVMDLKGKKMLTQDYSVEAKLAQHHKDVRLILDSATRAGLSLPLSRLHDELLSIAEARGLGDQDNSAIFEVFAGEP